ncbi:hypothetical protein GLAREA_09891 [Glarea lozoyensis ATCC 20868]|uniref:Uncharacterized protein n=1 Tax=Glarea lozoyensis (strain ATCC 20868 / MF5171) TaxID=1116229 RepID=S3CT15_GLAL2|nr:uncharacterized protein GLAREA_09891 [Glarea lozoyensis ATCC 20868]EPE28770.1 hypothetical protein GLAREA_09891 [Glarea lozoyensis ATCC 20868]
MPTEKVAHLILSGGLGNSIYVQSQLRARYSSASSEFPNAPNLQVRVAPEPQLVVCKGIVADRVQKLRSGRSMLNWRCCRASYGTKCKVLYNPANPNHSGQRTALDTLDGKMYVTGCVNWFIKKGEPVCTDSPIVKPFLRKFIPAIRSDPCPDRIFHTSVVTSDLDTASLPLVMNPDCRKLCELTLDLSSIHLSLCKLKNRHWWQSGEKYHRIEEVIKVILGLADISFELWYAG